MCITMPFKRRAVKYIFSIIFIIFYFSSANYTDKTDFLNIKFNALFKYAYFDSEKFINESEKIGIALHDSDKYRFFYNDFFKKEEEIVMYPFASDINIFTYLITHFDADVIYARINSNAYPIFKEMYKKFGTVSAVLTDNNIEVIRIVKNKP